MKVYFGTDSLPTVRVAIAPGNKKHPKYRSYKSLSSMLVLNNNPWGINDPDCQEMTNIAIRINKLD